MLPCVCSVIDHRRRQNVVRTSVTHSAMASCATFLFLPHFDVICDLLLNRRTATWNLFVNVNTIRNQVVIPVLNSRRGEFSRVNSPSFSRDVIAAMLADESKRSVISFFCWSTRSRTFPYCYWCL